MTARDRLIVALDFPSRGSALDMVDRLEDTVLWYKVGLELYLAEGRRAIEDLRERGHQVFLDLKLHDIPNTVAGGVRSVCSAGAGLLTVHALGGPAMLTAAADAAREFAEISGATAPRLLAVTVLTSMDEAQIRAIGLRVSPSEQAWALGAMALGCGVDGLVCSPEEIDGFRGGAAKDALLVVPGIRAAGSAADDQRRTASPAEALRRGASMLVMGRPITKSPDPARAASAILQEMDFVLAGTRA